MLVRARAVTFSLLMIGGLLAGAAFAAAPQALRQVDADQRERERDRDVARAESEAAHLEVIQLEAQLTELSAGEQNGERSVSDKRLQLAALTAREVELNAKLGGNQGQLARLLGALELFRADPPPALFTNPHDVRDAVRAAILIRAVTPELERRAQGLRAQALDLRRLRRQVATTSEALFTGESDIADRKAKIETLIAAKSALERQAAAQATAAGLDVDALSARARGLRDLARGVTTAPAPPGVIPPPDPEHAGPLGRAKPFTAPVDGLPVRRFGAASGGVGGKSQGWTWRPSGGGQVVAPATGVLEYAEPLKGWGVVLIFRLGGGYRVVLAGLDAPLVAAGQKVVEGQPVGRLAPGSTPSEIYLEIRKNGVVVDPAHWLPNLRRLASEQ